MLQNESETDIHRLLHTLVSLIKGISGTKNGSSLWLYDSLPISQSCTVYGRFHSSFQFVRIPPQTYTTVVLHYTFPKSLVQIPLSQQNLSPSSSIIIIIAKLSHQIYHQIKQSQVIYTVQFPSFGCLQIRYQQL